MISKCLLFLNALLSYYINRDIQVFSFFLNVVVLLYQSWYLSDSISPHCIGVILYHSWYLSALFYISPLCSINVLLSYYVNLDI